jgi:outer membrane protein TolC
MSFKSIITLGIALCATALLSGQALAQAVTDARVRELLAQAKVQVQQASPESPANPANLLPLTIDDAVRKALDQNVDLTAGRLGPPIQDFAIAQALGVFRPTVTSALGTSWLRQQPTSQLSGGQNVEAGTSLWNAGVSQILPWSGGTASLNWTNSRANTTSNNAIVNPTFKSGLTVSLTQPLFKNFKIDYNRETLLTARVSREMADVTLSALQINTVANVKDAYWDLVYAVQAVDNAKTSLTLAQKLVDDNQTRVEIGTLAPLDVVSAQAAAATRQQTLVQVEANRRTAEVALKRLLVSGTSDPLWTVSLNPVDRPPTDIQEKVDLEAALRIALEKRTDLVLARESLRSSEISVRYLKNQTLPEADLVASYGATGTGGPLLERSGSLGGEIIGTVPGGYPDALSLLRSQSYPSWNVQINVTYPVGASAAKGAYAGAKLQYEQALIQLKSLELAVATDLTTAALTAQSNFESVQAARVARELSDKQLETMQGKFDVGMETNYDVVLAQRDFIDAQNTELLAVLNYRKSIVDFQRKQLTASTSSTTSTLTAVGSSSTTTTSTGSTTTSSTTTTSTGSTTPTTTGTTGTTGGQ